MNREDIRRKYGLIEENKEDKDKKQEKETTKTTGGSLSRSEIAKKHGISYDEVDDNFINTFISDANKFISADEKSSFSTWNKLDLGSRANTFRGWLYHNKSNIDEKTYKSLSDTVDRFIQLNKHYSRFETEEDYNDSQKLNELYSMSSEEIKPYLEKPKVGDPKKAKIIETINSQAKTQKERDNLYSIAGITKEDIETYKTDSGIAYTTLSGKNITWQELYDNKLAQEDFEHRYKLYSSNPDWEEKSQGINTYEDTKSDFEIIFELSHSNVPYDRDIAIANGVDEASFNDIEKKRNYISEKYGVDLKEDIYNNVNIFNDLMTQLEDKEGEKESFEYLSNLTDEERKFISYIYNTQGRKAALEWQNSIENTLQARANQSLTESMSRFAEEHPVSASLGSVLLSPIAGVQYVGDVIDYAATGELDTNPFALASSTIRGTVSNQVDWEIGNWDAFDFLYNTGMSMADSAFSMKTMGSFGGISQGLSAAAQATNDAISRGVPNKNAFLTGLLAGTFEGVFESVSIGKLKALKDTPVSNFKDFAKNIGKAMLVNASEETLTEIANVTADICINGGFSQYETAVRQYMNQGMTEAEARRKASIDTAGQIVEAGLSGALMGFGFGVSGSGSAYLNTKNEYNQQVKQHGQDIIEQGGVDSLVALAMDMMENDQATGSKKIKNLAGKVEKNALPMNIGKLSAQMGTTITNQNQAEIQSALESKGLSKKEAKRVAEYLVNSQELTSEQKAEVEGNENIKAVIEEMVDNPKSTINERSINLLGARLGVDIKSLKAQSDAESTTEGKLSPLEENIVENEFEVSADGKTINNKNDKIVNIKKIESISKDGEVNLALDDGMVVKASDLSYGSNAEAIFISTIGAIKLGDTPISTTSANALYMTAMKEFRNKPNMSSEEAVSLVRGLRDAYIFGAYNGDRSKLTKTDANGKLRYYAGELTQEQRDYAYKRGEEDSVSKVDAKQKVIDSKVEQAKKKVTIQGKKGKIIFEDGGVVDESSLKDVQKANLNGLKMLAELSPINFHVFKSTKINGKFTYTMKDGSSTSANGWYVSGTNDIYIDLNAGQMGEGTMLWTAAHEISHYIREWSPKKWKAMADFIMQEFSKQKDVSIESMLNKQIAKIKRRPDAKSKSASKIRDEAYEELVSDALSEMLVDGSVVNVLAEIKQKDKKLWQKIKEAVQDLLKRWGEILGVYEGRTLESEEAKVLKGMEETFKKLQEMFAEAFADANATFEAIGVQIDTVTNSVAPMLSERTWKESDYATQREEAAQQISNALNVDIKTAYKYIDDINSVARLIADDRVRLDYEPNIDESATVLKKNKEYKYSVDMSTLCAKRLLTTGTFDAIQKRLPNTVFDSEDVVALREMMLNRGYEVACGICYVESTRREMGRITQDFIDSYIESQKTGKPITRTNSKGQVIELKKTEDEKLTTADKSTNKFYADKNYTPTLADLNTTDIDLVKKEHPLVYEAYLNFMNTRGQSKPKLLETRAEYKGEILKHFKTSSAVSSRNNSGGLRLQSFSDFEVPHLIDMMQIVMDMSRVGLKSQAYTKVPAFAEVFGNTGVKINLSLIAKGSGLDANGNLIFDDVEGINQKEAFKLRDKFSKNVGTILVGKNDAHIIAAMADSRIDYIIPFHKSFWKESLYEALGLTGYADYTDFQNEKPIDKSRKIKNFDPSEYWDFTKSGDENAQIYLEKCREDGRIPKFPQFQGYPGYWKLLIDFKMYDNDGVGSPQEVVNPTFEMDAAEKILNEYKGGHRGFPVANDVVEDFVNDYVSNAKFSDRGYNLDEHPLDNYNEIKITSKERWRINDALNERYRNDTEFPTYVFLSIFNSKLNIHNQYCVRWKGFDDFEVIARSEKKLDKIRSIYNEFQREGQDFLSYRRNEKSEHIRRKYSRNAINVRDREKYRRDDSILSEHSKSNEEKSGKSLGNSIEKRKLKLSDRDSEGNELSKEQHDFFKDSKVRDAEGRLIPMYHGTPNGAFNEFKLSKNAHSSLMAQYGAGYYFDANKESAKRYTKEVNKAVGNRNSKVFEVYLNITNPLVINDEYLDGRELVITKQQFNDVVARGNYEWYFTNGMPFELSKHLGKTKEEIQQLPREEIIEHWVDMIYDRAYFDSDILSAMVRAFKGDSILQVMKDVFGNDGVKVVDKYGEMWVAWDSNQIKETTNKKPTTDPDIRYSDRDSTTTTRSILANALEGVAQNDIEKNKLAEYKEKISQIEVEEQRLSEIQKKLFTKDGVEPSKRRELQFEAKQIANRINTYDRQLLRLEATKPLQNVLNREKALAMKRQKQKDNEYLKQYKEKVAKTTRELITRNQESRKKAVESRNKTAMRHKIKKVVSDLNNLLLKPSKERHVPEEMRIAVAEALNLVNMDTVSAEERASKYNALIAKATDPDVIASLTETRDRILNQGSKLADKLTKLKEAYELIGTSEDDSLKSMYDDVIYNKIKSVQEKVGKTPLRNMTLEQLENVYDLYKMVLTTIRDSNKAFAENITMSRLALGSNTFAEIKENNKVRDRIKYDTLEKFLWQNLKPMQAIKKIGSGTLQKLWNNILYGQEVFAQDYDEAVKFAKKMKDKYGYKKWDLDKLYSFKSKSGKTMKISLEQMMSIYAYSKRQQADEHIEYGGIVLNEGIIKEKNKLGKTVKIKVNDSTAYRLDKMHVGTIIATLEKEAPGAKNFVDEMQKYLSETMGEKGNEVAMKMYGVRLFKEEHYFPLKSSKEFMEAANTKLKGDVKIKNKGMTKSTVEHARNPIVLENFLDVWGNHINEMALYHGLVLPLEDFSRTLNYSFKADESLNTDAESVKTALHDAFGDNADNYLNELLKAINGGVLHDSSSAIADKMISKFKKAKVMASLSVIVQQPTAIIRAMGMVEPKYFVAQNFHHKSTWEELKKYCPTAIIKETGSFDTNMGRTIVDMIKDEQGFTDKVGDFLGKAPAYMDEVGWNMIWRALKKKVAAEQKLSGEELLKESGKQMTLIINETQVYDSVMSRNELMRSKSAFTKMATAFMAEPSTVANMIYGVGLDFKRGKKGIASKTLTAVITSVVINGLVSAMVYALRDDDEEKTLLEKYLSSATTEVLDGLNPLTYIPYVKDAYSLFQGYKVERTDMALIKDVVNAIDSFYNVFDTEAYKDMSREEIAKHIYENSVPMLTSICDMFGLPVGNVLRDAKSIIINDNIPMSQTSSKGIGYAVEEGVMSALPKIVSKVVGTDSKQDKLYDAIVGGDAEYVDRLKSGYKDDKAYEQAVRKTLRENDSRIKEAAEARIDGNISEYTRIVKEIKAEGFFSQDTIVASINAEINAINKGESSTTETSTEDKESSIYKMEDYYASIVGGDEATAYVVKEDIINTDVVNGKEREDAEDSFNSRFASHVREQYEDGYISEDDARDILVNYGDKSEEDATSKVQYWAFKQEYPDYDDLSEEAVDKYYNEVESYGISIDVYYDYSKQKAKCKGTDNNGDGKTDSGSKKAEILQVINSLPLTYAQKDALYYLNGWSAKTIYEAPWH